MTPRGKIMLAMALTLPAAGALWTFLRRGLPPIEAGPMHFAAACIGTALLLTLVAGVEAVAHERLFSDAVDPLAGRESKRLIVNQRYLQNTLEQSVVFAAGLLLLAHYEPDLRAVAATAVTWVLGRWAFWIGYHIGPMWRGLGVFSMVQSLVVLAYGVGRFGFDLAGWPGVAALLGPFAAIEAWLLLALRKPPR